MLSQKHGGHANPNEFRCKFSGLPKKAQHIFPKIGWGGRLEVFRKFIQNGPRKRPLTKWLIIKDGTIGLFSLLTISLFGQFQNNKNASFSILTIRLFVQSQNAER